ncbi:MAG: crotonyl-CoA carboxylase/reductase [Dehalococcoidia bacterium]|nr:crotonyl-CoA carboxylase/reductase [Dehalococcoidia bacterium]MCB9483685.1 crotonyl-CoA carboxylase/reductase [Dehalococcoidia bacterium]MCB9491113.1 crotonyl-CoA carboxylase/reductase [Dehalococcoidia bacterium]
MPAIYDLGTPPPLGMIPERMHASVIRRERYGEPQVAFQREEVTVPRPGPGEVLVYVMAAGINYNNVWAALGKPLDVIAARRQRGQSEDFHIGGSDGAGIVWSVGDGVTNVAVGDPVVLSCGVWDPNAPDIQAGADPITSTSARTWGYEENWGTFAQYALVRDYQCHPKPPHLSWEEAAAYMLVGATAYRMLTGFAPHDVRPGDPVLIWGGAGGLGVMAIQIVRELGGIPIAVVSGAERAAYCLKLGAHGVIDRREFHHWGRLPDLDDPVATAEWARGARAFGERFWDVLGERRNPRIVFDHPGEQTIPTSTYVVDRAGMVVICAGTSGYNADVDLRHLWMRQKRLQGSHFANTEQCAALNQLVSDGRISPCLSQVYGFDEVAESHQAMFENRHPPGNMAILVNATRPGMTEAPWAGTAAPVVAQ